MKNIIGCISQSCKEILLLEKLQVTMESSSLFNQALPDIIQRILEDDEDCLHLRLVSKKFRDIIDDEFTKFGIVIGGADYLARLKRKEFMFWGVDEHLQYDKLPFIRSLMIRLLRWSHPCPYLPIRSVFPHLNECDFKSAITDPSRAKSVNFKLMRLYIDHGLRNVINTTGIHYNDAMIEEVYALSYHIMKSLVQQYIIAWMQKKMELVGNIIKMMNCFGEIVNYHLHTILCDILSDMDSIDRFMDPSMSLIASITQNGDGYEEITEICRQNRRQSKPYFCSDEQDDLINYIIRRAIDLDTPDDDF